MAILMDMVSGTPGYLGGAEGRHAGRPACLSANTLACGHAMTRGHAGSRARRHAGMLACTHLIFTLIAPARFHADGLQAGEAQFGEVAQSQLDGVVDAVRRPPRIQVIGDLIDVRADLTEVGEDVPDMFSV